MNNKCLLSFSLLLIFSSCDKMPLEGDEPLIPNSKQPTIPIYDQMLLSGNVLSVTSHVSYQEATGKGIETEYVEFDEENRAVKFCWDGVEMEMGPETTCLSYQSLFNYNASFDYPTLWTSIHSIVEGEGDYSFVKEWNESGRYIKMRYLYKGAPVKVEELGDSDLEKYLYDENGFPRYTFTINAGHQINICTESTYGQLDEVGNARGIHVITPNGSYDISRTILYR